MSPENHQNNICPNCENEFDSRFDFCPHCGQKNTRTDLRFKYFISEFLAGSFNLDSKIFRTLRLLIFYPGKLTREFITGKRMKYIPPVRLYLVISLVFFSLLSLIKTEVIKFTETSNKKENQQVVFGLDEEDTLRMDLPGEIDTLTVADNSSSPLESRLKKVAKVFGTKEGRKAFNERLPDYISIGMFVLMPITALIFYLMFYTKTFYIEHLVFVLHLQSAMFLLFIFINLIELVVSSMWIDLLSAALFLVLLILWIKNFYQLKWFRAIWKTIVFLFFYGFVFLFFIVVVAGINVLMM